MLMVFNVRISVQRISEDVETGTMTVSSPEEFHERISRDVSDELAIYADAFCARRSDDEVHYSVPDILLKAYRKQVAKSTDSDNPDDVMDQVMYDDFMESLQDYVDAEWHEKETHMEDTPGVIRCIRVKITGLSVEEEK